MSYFSFKIFLDLGERHLIRPDNIKKGRLLGRGAFGFVFKGTCRVRGSNTYIAVAMKMLQPVQPGANARQSAVIAYKVKKSSYYVAVTDQLSSKVPDIKTFYGVCQVINN